MITLVTTVLLVAGSALQSFGDAEQHAHISATDEAFGGILPETRELRSLDMDAAMKKYTRVGSSPYMRFGRRFYVPSRTAKVQQHYGGGQLSSIVRGVNRPSFV
ncbi:hypothetical protein AAVH_30577 [Aphelenchoides avenae]|nr:hypothetical protein AAVH_30577 [Aphelenchus avenae]